MLLIGISGRAGSGKTTLRNFLCEQYIELTTHNNIVTIPFAKALKDLAVSLGWNGLKDEKGRKLLQLLGTDVCRECLDDSYWITKWREAYVKACVDDVGCVIVDDLRFPNEHDFLRRLGGYLVKITGRAYTNVDDSHPSEQDLRDSLFDKIIVNESTAAYLRLEAKVIMKELLKWTY